MLLIYVLLSGEFFCERQRQNYLEFSIMHLLYNMENNAISKRMIMITKDALHDETFSKDNF